MIKNCDFLLVIFQNGLGGNHCRNILRTSTKISDGPIEECKTQLLNQYTCHERSSYRVHYSDHLLNLSKITNTLQSVLSNLKSGVTNVGMAHRLSQEDAKKLTEFQNIQTILFSTSREFSLKRAYDKKLDRWHDRLVTKEETPECDIPPSVVIDPYVWCSTDPITEIIKLDHCFDLELDYDFCLELHRIWYDKIFRPYQ